MKKILILSIASAAMIATLTGCGLFDNEEKVAEEENLSVADNLMDQQLYEEAIQEIDATKCEEILSGTMKDECEALIEAKELTAKAVEEADEDYCDDIELDRYKENCLEKVGEVHENEKYEKLLVEENKLSDEYIENDDLDACDDLTIESEMMECKHNIILYRATKNNDPDYCDNLPDESAVQDCLQEVEAYNATN